MRGYHMILSGLMALFISPICFAQLVVGGQGSLNSYQPSQNLGRFETGVSRNAAAGSALSRFGRSAYRPTGLDRSYLRAGAGGGRPMTPRSSMRQPTGATAWRDEYPTRSASGLSGYGGQRPYLRGSSSYMADYAPRPRESVVDILARGADARYLPAAPLSEEPIEGSADLLPTVYAGPGEQLAQWAKASQRDYVEAGMAQLRKKDLLAARSSFETARLFDPNDPEPQIGLIQTTLLIGHYNQAAMMIRHLCRRAPDFASRPFDVKTWHETQESYDEFTSRFRTTVADTSKTSERNLVLMGYVAWTTGDRQQALDRFRQAAAEVPQERGWVSIIRVLESPVAAEPSELPKETASAEKSSARG